MLHIFLRGSRWLPSTLTHLRGGTGRQSQAPGTSSRLQTPPTDCPMSTGSPPRAGTTGLQAEMGLSPRPGGALLDGSNGLGSSSSQQVDHEALTPIQVSFWSADGPAPGLGSEPPLWQNTLSSAGRVCLPA